MEESLLEIYIADDGSSILLLSLPEIEEFLKELGRNEFDFTPYCG